MKPILACANDGMTVLFSEPGSVGFVKEQVLQHHQFLTRFLRVGRNESYFASGELKLEASMLGSITSRCSGKEPALLPRMHFSRGGTQTRHERAGEIEPTSMHDPCKYE